MNTIYTKETGNAQCITSRYLLVMMLAWILSIASYATCFAESVALSWDANLETNLSGYKVYYKADVSAPPFNGTEAVEGASPIDVHNQANTILTGLDPSKTYYFAITAYNTSGLESVYSSIVTVLESVAPTVTVSAPTNNSTVSGTVSVTASASDNVGVTKVEFYVNGVLQSSDTATPYVYSWNTSSLASGTYTIMAKAYDAAGNVGQSSNVVVTVINDTTAPVVTLTAPGNNATVSGTVAIMASASDNVGVNKVEFYENGVLLSAGNVTPYSYNWNTTSVANGSYTLTGKAYDNAGNIGQSTSVTVLVNNIVPDTTAPVVGAFTMPTTATSLSVAVSSFSATDAVGVTGYLITESAAAPSAGATGWSGTAPSSFTFSAAGSKTAYAWAKDAAGNVSSSRTAAVTITLPDTTAPVVSAFTMPTTATSLSVAVSSFSATDAVGVTGYLITESATAPSAGATGWSGTAPTSFTFSAAGSKTAYAWAKDAAGNVSSSLADTVTITLPDTTAPVVSAFTMPTTATSLTVAVSSFSATDAVGVTGYLITESATAPSAGATGWSGTAPTSFTFSAAGSKTAYAWAKDAAGNVSSSRTAVVTITLPDTTAPVVSAFTMPTTATSLSVAVTSFSATDAVGVTGYLITESATAPSAGATGWSGTAPTFFTFSAAGSKTAYAWAKDAAGNVSSSLADTVTITLPDTTAPVVGAFTMPATATSLSVAVSLFSATDAVGVTGYLITESATAPSAGATGWSATAPSSFTFSAAGSKTAYAWAKDAAGNVSSSRTAAVTITLPDTTAPVVSAFTMPTTATSLSVAVSSFSATDAVGVTGYLITESATAPSAGATGWSGTAPTSFTFSAAGSKTAYAWAKDAAGNVSSSLADTVTITLPDTTAPVVNAFTMPATATSLTVAVSSFSATDAVGVTGYLIAESTTAPAAGATGWSASAPTSFTFSAAGSKTAYAWAKDAAGNVSSSRTAVVTITLPDTTAPVVSAFTMPTTATSLTVAVSSFSATDAVGVTGYLITESATAPSAGATGWSGTAPTSFTFSAAGSKAAYAWAKDAAGNVSSSSLAAVNITLADTTGPLTISDALASLNIAVGKAVPTTGQMARFDVAPMINGNSAPNGKIDIGDVIVILGKVTGKIAL